MLWEVDIHPAEGQPDLAGQRTAAAAEEMNLLAGMAVATARGFLIQGNGSTPERYSVWRANFSQTASLNKPWLVRLARSA